LFPPQATLHECSQEPETKACKQTESFYGPHIVNYPIAIRLRELIHAAPFMPFSVKMVDGTIYHIPHEDFLVITRSGRVFFDDGEKVSKSLNVTLIAEIDEHAHA